jgi:hypothetical protein
MKIQTLGWLIGFTAIASSASVLACSQAKLVCQAGHAGSGSAFAAKYYPVGTPGAACVLPGDEIGFETYHPKGGGDDGAQPDFAVPSLVALQTTAMGTMIQDKKGVGSSDPDRTNVENADGTHTLAKDPPYALGTFAGVEPDADGFCVMAAPAPAVQNFPAVAAIPPDPMADPPDPGADAVPAEAVKYEWTNVKVYVTASAQGTQFSGHLKYTDDTCIAEYNVAGLWPSIPCNNVVEDGVDMMGMKKFKVVAEPAFCCPSADPLGPLARTSGSGINPDFPMKCEQIMPADPDPSNGEGGFRCVLDVADPAKLPVLNPGWDANVAACKVTAAAQ